MRKPSMSFNLTALLLLILFQYKAWAAPGNYAIGAGHDVIVSDESKIIKIKQNEISIDCEGSYDDEYNSEGWEEDIYVAKIQTSEIPGILFKGKIARGQHLDCPSAATLLKQEAFNSGGFIHRKVRRQVVNVTYTAFDRGYLCVRYTYIRYSLKLFGKISEKQDSYSGYVRIHNDTKTPGTCPINK